MPKLSPSETTLIKLLKNNGGSICLGADATLKPEIRRIIRRLERKGMLNVEQTDDGYRYSVREAVNG